MTRLFALTLMLCLGVVLPLPNANAAGYLHSHGATNLDINNQPIILRGVDLGSWLWPEYYMMGNPDLTLSYGNAGTGTGNIANYYDGFLAAIMDLMGGNTNLAAQVIDAYWTNYITAADIVYLHQQGFNSVRVPFDFEEFFQVTNWANNYPTNGYDITNGFKYLDNLVAWCSTNGIYVIPDFHCPPGGPNNLDVVNYGGTTNTNTASVFTSPSNLLLTGHIWARIAAHYATNSWIGGYDLLNEPVATTAGSFQVGSPILANTYSNLVKAIRAVDANHMILCEGDDYASTLYDVANTGWTDPDANISFSDHDYGSPLPLDTGNRSTAVGANYPDWGGEFGINSTMWYNHIVFGTYENPVTLSANGKTATITEGHAFWAYKSTDFYTVVENPQTPGWNNLKAYWASGNTLPKPSVTNAYNWLVGYAQAANFSNCVTHPEIVDSLFRPTTTSSNTGFSQLCMPYKTGVTIPGKIFAVDYDMGDSNIAYVDTVSQDEANNGPYGENWNNGNFGRDEGVDTTFCNDPGTLLKIGWNDAGEWQRHSVTCTPGTYNLYIRYGGAVSGAQISVSLLVLNPANNALVISSNNVSGIVTLPVTGDYTDYGTYMVPNVVVTNSGAAKVAITVVTSGYDLVWVEFLPVNGPPLPPTGETMVGIAPATPPALTAGIEAFAGNSEASLNWVTAESATNYNVKRSLVSGGPYTTIASVPTLSYLDTGLTNGTTYYYVVTAVNVNGESANSTEVNATPHSTGLAQPLMDRDVGIVTLWSGDAGDVGWSGSAGSAFGLTSVTGSGTDIWTQVDSFHYAYRGVSGNCTNMIHVDTLQNTDGYAKAGLMIRDSLNPDSDNALIGVTSQNGAFFSWRPTNGLASSSTALSGLAAPYWVKLVRIGNTFTGYTSSNAVAWTQVGTATFTMSTSAFVGLAVTAHNNTLTNTATFDSLTVSSQLPAAPVNLNATTQTFPAALTWTPSPNAINYKVKRATSPSGPFTTIASSVVTTNYTDSSVTAGVTYYYVVSAVNANGESVNSNEASFIFTLPTIVATFSSTSLTLSWPATPPFALYSATNLSPPIVWSPVTNATVPSGSNLTVTLPIGGGNLFYHLKSQ